MAWAPTAVSQSPSKTFRTFLSACALWNVSLSLILSKIEIISLSLFRHWIAIIPWPALGIILFVENTSVILSSIFNDLIPA